MWLEWRPAVSRLANNVEEALGPWTRLGERPPRVVSGEVLITRGAVEIDVDTLAKHREIVCPPSECVPQASHSRSIV